MAAPTAEEDREPAQGEPTTEPPVSRRRAALAVLPFLLLGLADVALLVGWGLEPLWGFAVLPPIAFICVLTWVAFRTGFVTGEG